METPSDESGDQPTLVSSNASRGGQQESRGADNKQKATHVDAGGQWEDF